MIINPSSVYCTDLYFFSAADLDASAVSLRTNTVDRLWTPVTYRAASVLLFYIRYTLDFFYMNVLKAY